MEVATIPEPVEGEVVVLTDEEQKQLRSDEDIIARGVATFREVGEALFDIQQKRLYRAEFSTFEDYVHERWEMGRAYAYRLIDSYKTVDAIEQSSGGDTSGLRSEGVARVLVPILREEEKGDAKVAEAWKAVVEEHGVDSPVTAREVRRILEDRGFIEKGGGAGRRSTGTAELVGAVGDALATVEKRLDKAESGIKRRPGERARTKLVEYSEQAELVAERLRSVAKK